MNILQIMPEFGLAGAERMCETLCRYIQTHTRHKVYVVSLFDYHSSITDNLESRGIKIIYLDKKKGLDIGTINRLCHVMKKYNIDLIHTHRYVMQYAIPAAMMAGVKKRVHTIHNVASKEVEGLAQKLADVFYKRCRVVPVSISPLVQDSVMERYGLSVSQTPVIFNGTDLSRCVVKSSYHTDGIFNFVHIGRLSEQKNHRGLIEAAAILRDRNCSFKIHLVGEGILEQEIRDMVKTMKLDDNIVFCGLQNNVYPYLAKADAFILPSLYEGLPVTLTEAMGCGLPIIATKVGGIPDMIEDMESGILTDTTPESFAEAMHLIIGDETLRQKIGRNAFKDSIRFSADQMGEKYISLYESLR